MTVKILMGGSPCVFWSIAQKQNREVKASGLGWELFKNYLIAKEKFQPDYFLYENNKSAAQAIKDQISYELGVPLQHINSALVSAQNRQRFYAHNIPDVPQPEDRVILLKDILESGTNWCDKSYCLTTRCHGAIPEDTLKRSRHTMVAEHVPFGENKDGKAYCLDANYFKGMDADKVLDYKQRTMVAEPVIYQTPRGFNKGGMKYDKAPTITANGSWQDNNHLVEPVVGCKVVNIPQTVTKRKYEVDTEKLKTVLKEHKKLSKLSNKQISEVLQLPQTLVEHWFRNDDCFAIPDADVWFELKKLLSIKSDEFDLSITEFIECDGVFEKSERCYCVDGKMSTLMTGLSDNIIEPVALNTTTDGKAQCLRATCYKDGMRNMVGNDVDKRTCVAEPICVAERGRNTGENGKVEQNFEPRLDGKTNTLTTVSKDNQICEPVQVGLMPQNSGIVKDSQATRIYNVNGKAVSLKANGGGWGAKTGLYAIPVEFDGDVPVKAVSCADGKTYPVYCVLNGKITIKEKEYDIKLADGYYIIRKLTVIECCRLQGMPDWWFLDDDGKQLISNTQCYKGLGNGWQKDTVQHIMSYLPVDKDEKIVLLSLYDGIGTARKILEDLGYKNVLYIAYEIDKYCVTVTSYRYPDVVHMGDCFDIRNDDWLEKIHSICNEHGFILPE